MGTTPGVTRNMNKEEIIAYRSREIVKGLPDIEVLKLYYSREDLNIILTEKQERLHAQISMILRLQSHGLPSTKIILKLKRVKEWEMSENTAWLRLRAANELHGKVIESNAKVKMHNAEEMILSNYMKAKSINNLKEMNVAAKAYVALCKELNKESDFDKEKLEKGVYVIALESDIRQKLGAIIDKGGSINLDDFLNNVNNAAEEIEFTAINENENEDNDNDITDEADGE